MNDEKMPFRNGFQTGRTGATRRFRCYSIAIGNGGVSRSSCGQSPFAARDIMEYRRDEDGLIRP